MEWIKFTDALPPNYEADESCFYISDHILVRDKDCGGLYIGILFLGDKNELCYSSWSGDDYRVRFIGVSDISHLLWFPIGEEITKSVREHKDKVSNDIRAKLGIESIYDEGE